MVVGDAMTYRVETRPDEVTGRLRDWHDGIDRFSVRGDRFSVGPHGIWRWISWRRWLSLSGRISADGRASIIDVWFPFETFYRVVFVTLLVITVVVGTVADVQTAELLFVGLIVALNIAVLERAKAALRATLETALSTPLEPHWRYPLKDTRDG